VQIHGRLVDVWHLITMEKLKQKLTVIEKLFGQCLTSSTEVKRKEDESI